MADSDSEEYLSAEEDGTAIKGEHTPGNEQNVRSEESMNDGVCSSNTSELSDNLSAMHVHESCDQSSAEFVSNIDNKYVSEGTDDLKDEMVELTEEQIKEMKEQANKLKASGNEAFKSDSIEKAVEFYSDAIKLYPKECTEELAICYANRAACNIKIERHDDVVQDCTKALELRPDYLKALMRRAQSNEALEKLEDALEDYKKALELDPSQTIAGHAVARLPHQIKEQQEKMKEEMIGKLKELGNAVLKPFGLSTNNFQLQQDPNSGGYSINFNR